MIEHLANQCPLCGAGVSQSRFAELQARIHEEERQKLENAMRAAREQLEETHRMALATQAESFRIEAENLEASRMKLVAAQRLELDRTFAERFQNGVANAVAEVSASLEERLTAAKAETQELRAAITDLQKSLASVTAAREVEIDAAVATSERRHREEMVEIANTAAAEGTERLRLEGVVAEFEAKWQAFTEAKASEATAALEASERAHKEELAQQRAILEKDREDKVLKAKLQHLEDDQKVQKKLGDMQRQLEKRTADELGHWPEVDLYQAVQEEFKDDRVTHIAKGEAGADIRVEVMHRGESCGTIIADSKNRKQWQDRYVDKLAQDRLDAKAEHAILASNVFPAGTKDLCIRGGVIVTRPLSVVPILQILRAALVSNHVRRLSAKQREEKASQLYEFINSLDFRQTIDSVTRACEELEGLDVDEKRDHENVWRKRGKLQRDIAKAVGNAESRVNEILEGNGGEEAPAQPRLAQVRR